MPLENCPFDVTPFDESNLVRTPNLINTNYTNQDFWSMKSRLVGYIKTNFTDSFNDFVESDLAVMLIENWAFIADTLSFKIDQIANEIFIDTVSEVDNAFRLCLLVGFAPQPPIAARSLWSVTINNVLETDMVIPTPVTIDISTDDGPRTIELYPADSDNNPIFDDNIEISAGNFVNTSVVGLEGRSRDQTTQGSGAVSQIVPLTYGPVIWNSVRVFIDGIEWEKVDYFTDSEKRREFRVDFDPDYNGFVLFGGSKAGLIPYDGAEIRITYRTGGGTAGNIVTGSVEIQRTFLVPGFDFRIPVSFINYTKGEFGYAGDTIDDIRRKLPQYLRTQNRAVAGEDYKTLADQFATEFNGQIGKSTAILRNYGCAANIVDLYVLARDGETNLIEANDQLKVALQEMFDTKKMITDYLCIKDGVVIEVDTSIDVIMDKFYKKFKDEFDERIQRRVNSFYNLNNWEYNKDLKSVDLITSLADIREIKSVTVDFETDDADNSGELVVAKFYEIIRPSNTTINFIFE